MNDILLLVAVSPPLFLIFQIYKMDSVEREPVSLLIKLLIGGGLITFAASLLENAFQFLYAGNMPHYMSQFIQYFIVVAISEECCKYLVMRLLTWRSPEFNYTFDGVVYAVTVSLGFALVENVMYAQLFGMRTALLRAFTAIVLHAVCGVFMGCYYGSARQSSANRNGNAESMMNARSILIPVLIHGFYDFTASQSSTVFTVIFFIFLIFLYYTAYKRVNALERSDTPIQESGSYRYGDQRGYDQDDRNRFM
ncbi:MAG: PrsW family intramembrane metalloprotease [Eubacteriales bacterium]|nr:PrsW family intramembrane metalloprotease [Eubacteriales bacterium]